MLKWTKIGALAALGLLAGTANAQSDMSGASGFPGDIGRPFNGLPLPDGPHGPPHMPGAARGPSAAKALTFAKAAVAACKGFHVGVSVIDSEGAPKLYYIPDGTGGYHAYIAFRKAYTALHYLKPSSEVGTQTKSDPKLAAEIMANNNFMTFAGGLPILENGDVVGAIGVSGAEPSAEDERCALAGLHAGKPARHRQSHRAGRTQK